MKIKLVAALLALGAAGCGGASTAKTPEAAKATSPATTVPSTAASTTAATATPDAAAVVASIRAAGIPVAGVFIVTEANDGNHLLGRPNGYSSKEVVTDSRVLAADRGEAGGVDQGASVEVYPDAAGAKARAAYLASFGKTSTLLVNEYDYVRGGVLVRVTGKLTPTQAKSYKAVVDALPA